jgi:hypothetical protein
MENRRQPDFGRIEHLAVPDASVGAILEALGPRFAGSLLIYGGSGKRRVLPGRKLKHDLVSPK